MKGLQFGGQEMRRRQGADDSAARQAGGVGFGQRGGIPAIGKAEDGLVGGHQVKNQVANTPAAAMGR